MRRKSGLVRGLAGMALVAALSCAASAQVGLSKIEGFVIDPDNKPIAGAVVVFTRVDVKSGAVKLKADKKGYYVDSTLQVGTYDLDVYMADAKTKVYHQNSVVLNFDPLRLDVILKAVKPAAAAGAAATISKEDADAIMSGEKKAADEQEKVAAINELLAENEELRDQKNFAEAIPKMEKAVQIDATRAVLFANLGADYLGNKDYDKAIEAFNKAIALQPLPAKQAPYVVEIGNAYMLEGNQAAANEQFAKAKAMDPEVGKMASYNAAVGLFNAGKIDEAIAALDDVIANDPNNANAYYYKGLALVNKATMDPKTNKMVAPAGMVDALKKALALGISGANAATAKDILAQVQ